MRTYPQYEHITIYLIDDVTPILVERVSFHQSVIVGIVLNAISSILLPCSGISKML